MEDSKLKLIADFISESKTKKIFYTLSGRENESNLRATFFHVPLSIVSVSDTLDNLKGILQNVMPSGNPKDDYTLEEFKLEESEPIDNELSSEWYLYVYEYKNERI